MNRLENRIRQVTKDELKLLEQTLSAFVDWMIFNGLISTHSEVESAESIIRKFVHDILNKLKKINSCDWRLVEYGRLSSDSRQASVGKPLKIRGTICSKSDVMPSYLLRNGMDMLLLEIKDDSEETMKSCPVTDPILLNKVQQLFGTHHSFDLYGTIVPARADKSTVKRLVYRFFLIDIEASENPLQIIGATRQEISEARKLATRLKRHSGGILKYLKEEIVGCIGIKGLDSSPRLERALEFMILQSLSDGYDASRSISHRLHSMVIGSPAVGKKLLSEAARILNPRHTEAHPGRISVAGIAGTAVRKSEMWGSEPGLIPLAHRGVFVIQDFHHVNKKVDLMGILSMVMEDGRIINATAGSMTHNALTAVHIDLNRHSHIYLKEDDKTPLPVNSLSDIGVSMNVLTRFDFITEIPRDTARQMEIALDMHSGVQRSKRYSEKRGNTDRERSLQALVAYLRSEYADIEIPAQLSEGYIRPKQKELLDTNLDQLKKLQLLGDYQTRLSNSIDKLIFAIARGNARTKANKADVDEAFKFVATKLEFLRTIEDFEVPGNWNPGMPLEKVRNRQEFIRTAFAGRDVTVAAVHKLVQEKLDTKVSSTTIRRDLKEIGQSVKHGFFRIGSKISNPNGKLAKCT